MAVRRVSRNEKPPLSDKADRPLRDRSRERFSCFVEPILRHARVER